MSEFDINNAKWENLPEYSKLGNSVSVIYDSSISGYRPLEPSDFSNVSISDLSVDVEQVGISGGYVELTGQPILVSVSGVPQVTLDGQSVPIHVTGEFNNTGIQQVDVQNQSFNVVVTGQSGLLQVEVTNPIEVTGGNINVPSGNVIIQNPVLPITGNVYLESGAVVDVDSVGITGGYLGITGNVTTIIDSQNTPLHVTGEFGTTLNEVGISGGYVGITGTTDVNISNSSVPLHVTGDFGTTGIQSVDVTNAVLRTIISGQDLPLHVTGNFGSSSNSDQVGVTGGYLGITGSVQSGIEALSETIHQYVIPTGTGIADIYSGDKGILTMVVARSGTPPASAENLDTIPALHDEYGRYVAKGYDYTSNSIQVVETSPSSTIGFGPVKTIDAESTNIFGTTIDCSVYSQHSYQVYATSVSTGAKFFIEVSNDPDLVYWIRIFDEDIDSQNYTSGLAYTNQWIFGYARCGITGHSDGTYSVFETHKV